MKGGFVDYISLEQSLETLRRHAAVVPRSEVVPLGRSYGRVLADDVTSRYNIPARDSAHMDGYAVRSADLIGASEDSLVRLRVERGAALGTVPKAAVKRGEAHTVLTGGFMPKGADAVVQVERTERKGGDAIFSRPVRVGEFVYPLGRDIKKGEKVLNRGRVIRAPDMVLLGSLHHDTVPVFARPRVAVIPTGDELTDEIHSPEPGKVPETHSLFLSRLIEAAGGIPVLMPIARDNRSEITSSIETGLRVAGMVLTLAGSSVGEADLTEAAISSAGKPGVLVHGMKVHRGRVMGFGVVGRKAVIILPGPIQGAANAFALMAYPLIRSFLGRGFETPPSVPATMGNSWDAGDRYTNFSKMVYVKIGLDGDQVVADASAGETEKVTFLTQSDGYLLLGEKTLKLNEGDSVRVHLLPGLSPSLPEAQK